MTLSKNRSDSNYLVFVDFDGTVTLEDVGQRFSMLFSQGKNQRLIDQWATNRITARDCLEQECARLRFDPVKFQDFLQTQQLTPGFLEFVRRFEALAIPLYIVSDGLDLYIQKILQRFQLGHLPVFANHARIEGERVIPEFPYFEQGCGACGNCKAYHIRRLRTTSQTVIFIGDGLSDRCALEAADLIFAKNDLLRFCKQNHIPAERFTNFFNVMRRLTGHSRTLQGRKLKRPPVKVKIRIDRF